MNKIIFFAILLVSCKSTSFDPEKEKKEILRREVMQREYHFKKDARDFVEMFSKDFLSVNKGVINHPSRENSYKMFAEYFRNTEFIKWDDNKEPIIRFSNDGSIAYVAVDKLVIVKTLDKVGEKIMDTTNYAWLTVYKRYGNEWKIDCVTSTKK